MAKSIRISTDDVTYVTLPGSQGEFSADGESIEDTILGQSFTSMDTGLTSWSVSSDAIWKGAAGYIANLMSVGTPTAATTEAMTLVSGKTYQIDDTAKEIWDRSATITVYDNAVDHTADVATIDYLFGQVTFDSTYTVTGPITIDVEYFPIAVIGCAQSYTLTMTADTIDNTCFNTAQANGGRRTYDAGLRTVSFEIQGVYSPTEDWKTEVQARTEIIIEVDPAGDGLSVARGFFKLSTQSQSGAVGALEQETLNFNLYVPTESTNPEVYVPFGWKHEAGTTLNSACRMLLDSWEQELNTYYVNYLPSGTAGQSPLDGASGQFVVTDASLSGDLSSMNVFQASMQGTGAFTVI